MFPKWLQGGREAEPAADEAATVTQDAIEAKFSFERDDLPVGDGNGFCPLRDAAFRWCAEPSRFFASVGSEAEILYELRDGTFVLVRARGLRPPRRDGDLIWTAFLEPRASVVYATWALGFVRKRRLELKSPQMHELSDAYKTCSLQFLLGTASESYRPTRPVRLWAEKDYAWRSAGIYAHQIDAKNALDGILQSLRDGIEAIRGKPGTASCSHIDLRFIPLFTRYPVDPLAAPVEGIAITEAVVLPEDGCPGLRNSRATRLLKELRELLIAPVNLLIDDSRTVPGRRHGPTFEEVELAKCEMRENVGDLIRLAAALNEQSQTLGTATRESTRETATGIRAEQNPSAETISALAGALEDDDVRVLLALLAIPATDKNQKALAKEIAGHELLSDFSIDKVQRVCRKLKKLRMADSGRGIHGGYCLSELGVAVAKFLRDQQL